MDRYADSRYTGSKKYIENEPHDFTELQEIIGILRKKCPWDSTQTLESLKPCLAGETEEVLAAVDARDSANLCEELGDVLLHVLLMSEIAEESGSFTFEDVVQTLSDKMIRRHPFVFGDREIHSMEEGKALWKEIKAREKQHAGNPGSASPKGD